jgi:hypothetical protein
MQAFAESRSLSKVAIAVARSCTTVSLQEQGHDLSGAETALVTTLLALNIGFSRVGGSAAESSG